MRSITIVSFGNSKRKYDFVTIDFKPKRPGLTCKNRSERQNGGDDGSWPGINKCNAHGPTDALAMQTKRPRISRRPTTQPSPPRGHNLGGAGGSSSGNVELNDLQIDRDFVVN
jgi:hypothetical protein